MDIRGFIYVLAAASMWGTIGVFSREILNEGITPLEIAFWRAAMAGVMFLAHATGTRKIQVRPADLPALMGFGFVCVTVFYGAYQIAVRDVGIALASVLLYTAPAWVALLSLRLLGETMTRTKLVCVGVTILGVACISLGSGLQRDGASQLSWPGLMAGLLAGFTYALYYVFGKRLLSRYSTPTIFAYALPMGAAMLAPLVDFAPKTTHAWTMLVAMAVISSYGAFTAHYAGLKRLEATRASVIATFEPVVAALLAYVCFGEALSAPGLFGGAIIIAAAVAVVR